MATTKPRLTAAELRKDLGHFTKALIEDRDRHADYWRGAACEEDRAVANKISHLLKLLHIYTIGEFGIEEGDEFPIPRKAAP